MNFDYILLNVKTIGVVVDGIGILGECVVGVGVGLGIGGCVVGVGIGIVGGCDIGVGIGIGNCFVGFVCGR